MNRIGLIGLLFFLALSWGATELYAQGRLLRRVQRELENRAIEEIFGKEEERKAREEEDARLGRNRRGAGLDQGIPDVNQHLTDAHDAFSGGSYTSAKSSLRQALWGVELEMGQGVLASLPESVGSLQYRPDDDRVSSTGVGFVGLVIERMYEGGDDVGLAVSVGSDAGLFGLAGLALAAGYHAEYAEETNQKQIRFQDHQAYIQYDEDEGYTLGVPFGQSSVFILQGVNFATESEFMGAAGSFSIQTIKQKLGEQ
jgi:hypothetical protein